MLSAHPPGRGAGSAIRGLVTLEVLRSLFGRVDVVSFAGDSERAFAAPGAHLVGRPPPPPLARQLTGLRYGGAYFHPDRAGDLVARTRRLVETGELLERYDLVWSHSSLVARAGRVVEAGRRVLDIDNVAAAAALDMARDAGLSRRVFWRLNALAVGREERRRAGWHDHVTVTSAEERESLGSVRPPVTVLPNTVPSPGDPVDLRATGPRVLFVGSLDYGPNVDAVVWLAGEIVPALRARVPEAEVSVVGRGPVREVVEACARADVELLADVPSLDEHYRRARIVIAPTRTGGGTGRIKVIEAMAYGAAVVATSQGVSGLEVRAGHDIAIADGVEGLAEACAELLRDPDRAAALGAAARATWSSRRSPEHAAETIREIVEDGR